MNDPKFWRESGRGAGSVKSNQIYDKPTRIVLRPMFGNLWC
jgi:hypothetical protein